MPVLLLAAEALDLEQVCGPTPGAYCTFFYEWFGRFGPLVAGTVRAFVIVVLAFVAVRLLRRLVKRFMRGVAQQGVSSLGQFREKAPLANTGPVDLTRVQMRTETISVVLNGLVAVVVWAVAIVTILGTAGIQVGPLLASAGIVGVALGFGAQNLVKDFLAGTFIILEDQYGIGDVVNLREAIGAQGVSGTVEAVSLRITRLRDVDGTVWHVPNGDIRTAGNRSQQWARSLLDVGVAYDTDVDKACAVLKDVADELWRDEHFGPFVIDEPEVWGLERFEPNQMAIRMVIKVQPAKQWEVNRELRARIKRAFDAEGIEIPFPQHSVWLREPAPKAQGDGPAAGASSRARPS